MLDVGNPAILPYVAQELGALVDSVESQCKRQLAVDVQEDMYSPLVGTKPQ